MKDPLTLIGVAATAATATLLVLAWCTRARQARFPLYGYAGLAILLAGELLLFRRVEPVATYFTPIAWTGYLLVVDAAVFALRGHSRLRTTPRAFASLAFWSVPLWLIFEGYNLHLKNWAYVGMPEALWQQMLGSAWSFATIVPALFETADLLAAFGFAEKASARGWRFWLGRHNLMVIIGVLFLGLPLALPARWASYLFALVWLGFIFLLEPINLARGHDSLLADIRKNQGRRIYCLLAAGFICGLLWEFWNFWAAARWVYVFPIVQEWKIFEMPLPGYLGFPFFALEMFAMYSFVSGEWKRLVSRNPAQSALSSRTQ
jgi:hypothetical protein